MDLSLLEYLETMLVPSFFLLLPSLSFGAGCIQGGLEPAILLPPLQSGTVGLHHCTWLRLLSTASPYCIIIALEIYVTRGHTTMMLNLFPNACVILGTFVIFSGLFPYH